MPKLVSVIIPAYNVQDYIGETIESVLRQSYPTIEIIIINDGSTDKTPEIISKYAQKDSRIVVVNQENRGLSGARNTGLRLAKGEYLCIFDADDIMLPQKIEKQFQFLEKHITCEFIYSDVYLFLNGTKKVYLEEPPAIKDIYKKLIQYGNFINPNTVFFRKFVFEKYGGFDEALRGSEDWDYWLNLSRQGVRFCHQPEALTLYRMRNSGLSGNRVTVCGTGVQVLEKQKQLKPNKEILQDIDKTIYKWKLRLFLSYLQLKNWSVARQHMEFDIKFIAIYIIYRFLPFFLVEYLYKLVKQWRFSLRFKFVRNSKVEGFLN